MFHRLSRYSSPKNALIIVENNAKDAVFDPVITTSVSCDVYWECSNGYRETTTGTSHALSYTAAESATRKWVIRCAAGLDKITAIDANSDEILSIPLLKLRNLSTIYLYTNNSIVFSLSNVPPSCIDINLGAVAAITGALSALPPSYTTFVLANNTKITGSLADVRAAAQTVKLYGCTGITAASIAHLIAIRDLRVYSMGWLIAATGIDVVINSVYSARASYTYASGIALRYGGTDAIPSGTEGTTPPADGVTNGDWEWDAVNEIHIPLTPQAKMFICQNDPYAEGFNRWTFTKV